jgi:hypothetical protein
MMRSILDCIMISTCFRHLPMFDTLPGLCAGISFLALDVRSIVVAKYLFPQTLKTNKR